VADKQVEQPLEKSCSDGDRTYGWWASIHRVPLPEWSIVNVLLKKVTNVGEKKKVFER
jgi:hypothetical protein